jgi:hypothetical protein
MFRLRTTAWVTSMTLWELLPDSVAKLVLGAVPQPGVCVSSSSEVSTTSVLSPRVVSACVCRIAVGSAACSARALVKPRGHATGSFFSGQVPTTFLGTRTAHTGKNGRVRA